MITPTVANLILISLMTISCYILSKSVLVVALVLFIFLLSVRIGFKAGQMRMFDNLYEIVESKGYLMTVDEDGEFHIDRKYGDHWYKNK